MEVEEGAPIPFEVAIPDGDIMHFYAPNSDYPYKSLTLEQLNSEMDDKFGSWEEYFEAE